MGPFQEMATTVCMPDFRNPRVHKGVRCRKESLYCSQRPGPRRAIEKSFVAETRGESPRVSF